VSAIISLTNLTAVYLFKLRAQRIVLTGICWAHHGCAQTPKSASFKSVIQNNYCVAHGSESGDGRSKIKRLTDSRTQND